ncbi:MAG: GNAT family N-acetyltransferase [Actinomycetota bacterium]
MDVMVADDRSSHTTGTMASIRSNDSDLIDQVAGLLVDSFRELSPTWVPTHEIARNKVLDCLEPEMLSRVMIVDDRVVGFVGARCDYSSGAAWELHPIVVAESERSRGIGRALVQDIERLVAERGALTMQLGTSDEVGLTSLSDVDLFADPLAALQTVTWRRPHPLGFWLAIGYSIVGVIPDAEGAGKPSILLAKRL